MATSLTWQDLQLLDPPLGEGQAGTVWKARLLRPFRNLAAGDFVAIKRYKRWLFDRPGQHDRIFREVATGLRIDHPNVVGTFCLVNSPNDTPALVMRYYEGTTLDSLLASRRSNPRRHLLGQDFRLLQQLADGIQAIHHIGAIHRDIKPSNIIVDSGGHAVLMDLGVVSETLIPDHTQTDQFLGTIRYAQPRYLAGSQATVECDVYSLGAIAYELFFDEVFLGEGNWATLVAKSLNQPYPSTSDYADNCRAFENAYGYLAAEAVYWSCRTLLNPEPGSLVRFADAMSRQIWTQPFFEYAGRIHDGAPQTTDEAGLTNVSLNYHSSARNADLCRYSTDKLIFRRIADDYWRWRVEIDHNSISRDLREFESYLHTEGDDKTDVIIIRDGGPQEVSRLLALYRHNLLETDWRPDIRPRK